MGVCIRCSKAVNAIEYLCMDCNSAIERPEEIFAPESREKIKLEAATMIKLVEELREESRGIIDTQQVDKILVEAIDALDHSNFIDGLIHAIKAYNVGRMALESYENATETLKFVWAKFCEIRDAGKDVSEAQQLIQSARRAIRQKDYERGLKYVKEAEPYLLTAEERVKHRAMRMLSGMEKLVANIKLGKKAGGTLAGAQSLLQREADRLLYEARIAMKEEDYDQVLRLMERANRSAKELQLMQLRKMTTTVITDMKLAIANARKLGLDVNVANDYIIRAESKADDGKYEDALQYAKNADTLLFDLWRSTLTQKLLSAINCACEKILNAKSQKFILHNTEKTLQAALDAYKRLELSRALELANDAATVADKELAKLFNANADTIYRELLEMITALKTDGLDTHEVEALFHKIKLSIRDEHYPEALKLIKQCKKIASRHRERASRKMITELITALRTNIAYSKQLGVTVPADIEKMVHDAQVQFEYRNYDGANTLLTKASEYQLVQTLELLNAAFIRLDGIGATINDEYKSSLAEIEQLIKSQRYVDALNLSNNKLERIISIISPQKLNSELRALKETITCWKKYRINLGKIEEWLRNIELARKKDPLKVLKLIVDSKAELRKVTHTAIESELQAMRGIIEQLPEAIYDRELATVRDTIARVREFIAINNWEQALDTLMTYRDKLAKLQSGVAVQSLLESDTTTRLPSIESLRTLSYDASGGNRNTRRKPRIVKEVVSATNT